MTENPTDTPEPGPEPEHVYGKSAAEKFTELLQRAAEAPSGPEIVHTMLNLSSILVDKNISYGNSALDPVRVFSRASTEEQILVRLDDKLSRLQRGSEYPGDDTITDLIGYLVLLLVARRTQSGNNQ